MIKEFRINNHIRLVLNEGGETIILINGKEFRHCKALFLKLDPAQDHQNINSIDDAEDHYSFSANEENISAEEIFWAHCSNLQAWAENRYDTRLLHRNLAFPLLKKLAETGDKIASKIFKDEIALRMDQGNIKVMIFLKEGKFLDLFSEDEISYFFIENNKFVRIAIFNAINNPITVFFGLEILQYLIKRGDKTAEIIENGMLNKLILEANPTVLYYLISRRYIDSLPDHKTLRKLIVKKDLLALQELQEIIYKSAEKYIQDYQIDKDTLDWEDTLELHLTVVHPNPLSLEPSVDYFNYAVKDKRVIELDLTPFPDMLLFDTFPEPILELDGLKKLQIGAKGLKFLPNNFDKLSILTSLDIGFNELIEFPLILTKIKTLQYLNIEHNKISHIPEEINQLEELSYLNLKHNQIDTNSIKNVQFLGTIRTLIID